MAGLGAMTEPGVISGENVLGDADRSTRAALWGVWATAAWALVIAAIYVAAMIGTTLAAEWFAVDHTLAQPMIARADESYSFSLASLVATFVCCGAIGVIIRLKKCATVHDYLGLKPVAFVTLLNWIGLFVVMQTVVSWVLMWLDLPIEDNLMTEIYKGTSAVLMLWFTVIVAIPLFEEIFFRGFLLTGLAASFLRPTGAVLVTSGLWTALHIQYNAVGLTVVFCLGLLFGVARLRTGSLWVPIGLHMLENLSAMAAATAS
jgi:uncharacterized protein